MSCMSVWMISHPALIIKWNKMSVSQDLKSGVNKKQSWLIKHLSCQNSMRRFVVKKKKRERNIIQASEKENSISSYTLKNKLLKAFQSLFSCIWHFCTIIYTKRNFTVIFQHCHDFYKTENISNHSHSGLKGFPCPIITQCLRQM